MSDASDATAAAAAEAKVAADLTADDATIASQAAQLAADQQEITTLEAEAQSTAPGAPTSVTATAGNGLVVIAWAPPASGGVPTDYGVTVSPGGVTIDARTALTATVSSLTNGTAYTFSVVASNAAGAGPAVQVSATPVAPVNPPINPVTSSVLPVFSATAAGVKNFYTKLSASAPLDPQSATKAAAINKAVAAVYSGWTVNRNLYAPTYYEVDGSKVAKVTVKLTGNAGSPTGTYQIALPATAVPDPSSSGGYGDHGMVVVDTSAGTVTESWETVKSGTSWSAATAGQANSLTDSGVFVNHGLFTSESASHISYAATMVKPSDLASGVIAHVLAIGIPDTSGQFVAPADAADGNTKGGIPEGTYLRFAPGTVIPTSLPPITQMLGAALRDYGAIVVDTSGSGSIICANPASWTSTGAADPYTPYIAGLQDYQLLSGLPWSQLQVLAVPTS